MWMCPDDGLMMKAQFRISWSSLPTNLTFSFWTKEITCKSKTQIFDKKFFQFCPFFCRPEIVIIDLTIPWDDRVEASRSEKLVKFSTLVASIKAKDAFNVSYQSLEIGSYRQRLSDGSESAIKLLYNYILPKISYFAFRMDLINLVNYSSYEVMNIDFSQSKI